MDTAKKIIRDLEMHSQYAFTHGRTNNDMVNSMICCRYVGLDWHEWFNQFWVFDDRIKEHYDRIEPYLDEWFNHDALAFLV